MRFGGGDALRRRRWWRVCGACERVGSRGVVLMVASLGERGAALVVTDREVDCWP